MTLKEPGGKTATVQTVGGEARCASIFSIWG